MKISVNNKVILNVPSHDQLCDAGFHFSFAIRDSLKLRLICYGRENSLYSSEFKTLRKSSINQLDIP